MTLRIGTDDSHDVPAPDLRQYSSPMTIGRGVRHAVPDGESVALCGHEPAHISESSSWPGMRSHGLRCEACNDAVQQQRGDD